MTVSGSGGSKTYSKYYDAGGWIEKDKIGVSYLVEHGKKSIPVVHGIQQSIGALGADDFNAQGSVSISLVNPTDHPVTITIERVVANGTDLGIDPKLRTLNGKATDFSDLGSVPINNFGTEIPITTYYRIGGKKGSMTLKLARRTPDELERYFGPGNKPPYPWFKRP